jgi:methylmalonyl-CoA/ethylmalonyl-CoA epimerase
MIPLIDPKDRELLALPSVSQIGVVIKDMHPAMEFYSEVWNVGPFKIFEPEYTDQTYRGKPGNFKMRIALAPFGPVQFELIEPLEGDTIYDEFLKKKGEGIHHLGFDVDCIEDRITAMQKMGIEVLQSGKRPGSAFAYMDTESLTGIIMEYIER